MTKEATLLSFEKFKEERKEFADFARDVLQAYVDMELDLPLPRATPHPLGDLTEWHQLMIGNIPEENRMWRSKTPQIMIGHFDPDSGSFQASLPVYNSFYTLSHILCIELLYRLGFMQRRDFFMSLPDFDYYGQQIYIVSVHPNKNIYAGAMGKMKDKQLFIPELDFYHGKPDLLLFDQTLTIN